MPNPLSNLHRTWDQVRLKQSLSPLYCCSLPCFASHHLSLPENSVAMTSSKAVQSCCIANCCPAMSCVFAVKRALLLLQGTNAQPRMPIASCKASWHASRNMLVAHFGLLARASSWFTREQMNVAIAHATGHNINQDHHRTEDALVACLWCLYIYVFGYVCLWCLYICICNE